MKNSILSFCTATALAAVVLCSAAVAQEFSASAEEVKEWRAAAENEDAQAQYDLGMAYLHGGGVAKDMRIAVRWTHKAAEQGHVRAQFNLGAFYFYGDGVAKDTREAVRWWRKAAEHGHAQAQYNLGVSYRQGDGVPQNTREAVRWYRKAAEQGFAKAQFYVGLAYETGSGVIADKREEYIWYSIANASGYKAAYWALQVNWHEYLSPSEIRSAKKEAARRLEEIDRRKAQSEQESEIAANIATAPKPKDINIAAHVFENTWRSVVVVRNGDGQGSGVIVRPNIIATNCHVVDGRGSIVVYKADNRRADTDTAFSATIRRADKGKDFCLLDVDGLHGVPVTVRKYDTLSVGEDVYALGAPQGLELSLSVGVISQLREVDGDRFIQTDAAISPGSSGGGLFDSKGNLIGILTAKIVDKAAEGIGFAIPADLVLEY